MRRITYHGADAELSLAGRRVLFTHHPDYARGLACTGEFDPVCCGHSHDQVPPTARIENAAPARPYQGDFLRDLSLRFFNNFARAGRVNELKLMPGLYFNDGLVAGIRKGREMRHVALG